MKKVLTLVVAAISILILANASDSRAQSSPTEAEHQELISSARQALANYRVNQGANSFCYVEDDNRTVRGVNADQPVRIASVMKTMTTMWAVEKYGPNHRFVTKVYYQRSNGEMHIEGAMDPFFDRDRTYLLISDLNQAGITSVNRLTSDSKFYFNPELFEYQYVEGSSAAARARRRSLLYREDHVTNTHTLAGQREELRDTFNTAGWFSGRAGRYNQLRARQNPSMSLAARLNFRAAAVDVVSTNPLAGKPDVQVFEVRSAPLKNYVKIMNMWSINAVADELFHSMGGRQGFIDFLEQTYGMGADAQGVYSGSGLPLPSPRRDTRMTCSALVRLLRRLDLDLASRYQMDLSDVMMVAGVDPGTWGGESHAFVVKTGTLNASGAAAKNLAGSAHTAEGEVYFGVFVQSNSANGNAASAIQGDIAHAYGGNQAVNRTAWRFDPLDTAMRMARAAANSPVVP